MLLIFFYCHAFQILVFRNQIFNAFFNWSTFEMGLCFSYYYCIKNDPNIRGLKQTFNFSHSLERTRQHSSCLVSVVCCIGSCLGMQLSGGSTDLDSQDFLLLWVTVGAVWSLWCCLNWGCLSQLPWGLSCKESICQCRRHRGLIPGSGRLPWKSKWQPTSLFLPGKSHEQRSLMGYSPRDCKGSDTIWWLNKNNKGNIRWPFHVVWASLHHGCFRGFSTCTWWVRAPDAKVPVA